MSLARARALAILGVLVLAALVLVVAAIVKDKQSNASYANGGCKAGDVRITVNPLPENSHIKLNVFNVPLAGCVTFTLSCLQQPSLQPSNFAALLAATYSAVKGNPATSDVQLISGGIFGHSINGAYSAGASGGAGVRSHGGSSTEVAVVGAAALPLGAVTSSARA